LYDEKKIVSADTFLKCMCHAGLLFDDEAPATIKSLDGKTLVSEKAMISFYNATMGKSLAPGTATRLFLLTYTASPIPRDVVCLLITMANLNLYTFPPNDVCNCIATYLDYDVPEDFAPSENLQKVFEGSFTQERIAWVQQVYGISPEEVVVGKTSGLPPNLVLGDRLHRLKQIPMNHVPFLGEPTETDEIS
jgi:hypothetical protein